MDALFFLGVVTVLFGIVFAVLLSPKGRSGLINIVKFLTQHKYFIYILR